MLARSDHWDACESASPKYEENVVIGKAAFLRQEIHAGMVRPVASDQLSLAVILATSDYWDACESALLKYEENVVIRKAPSY